MLDKIRVATKPKHAQLDQAVYPVIQAVNSPESYAKLLNVFYGFFHPVYQKLDAFIDKKILPDYSWRRKPRSIARDLQAIGYGINPSIKCDRIPVIGHPAQAFGAMYVLEGSTMGGKIIAKKLQENTGFDDQCFHFFLGYGELNARMWGTFSASLEQESLVPFAPMVVDSAVSTFTLFYEWLLKNYPSTKSISKEVLTA